MRKLTNYEKEILKSLGQKLNLKEKIFLRIFPKFSFKVYQIGVRDKLFKK